ncbi:MAG: UbiD family decarboxylase [Gemmataceae bacterium]
MGRAEDDGAITVSRCVDDWRHDAGAIDAEIDPHLEMAEIHRRVYQAKGPAVLFTRVKGCAFPMVSNLFGTQTHPRFLFRDTLDAVRKLVELKVGPARRRAPAVAVSRHAIGGAAWAADVRPPRADPGAHNVGATAASAGVNEPRDGGAFVTLPQVYSEDADRRLATR